MKTLRAGRRPWWLPFLILLVIVGAAVRFVNLNAPPLDFHPTRQLRNSLVARAVYYDLLPSGASGASADARKRLLADSFERAVGRYEPPISESIVGFTFLLTGGESFAVPRIYETVFWLLAGVALFDLARRMMSPAAALVSLAYFLLLPFAVQAGRSFQPDPLMTASFVAGMYFLYRWMDPSQDLEAASGGKRRWTWAILAGAFLGFAVLVKVVIAFFVIGGAVAAVLATCGRSFWRSLQVWAMAALAAVPAFGYYVLGHPGRSTEYFFAWTVDLIKLVTSLHFYADWLGFVGTLFGLTSLLLGMAGTLLAPGKVRWMLIGCWLGYFAYGITLPFQMFTHSYYHIQLVPLVALGLAPIAGAVFGKLRDAPRWSQAAVVVLLVAAAGYQAWAARSAIVAENFSDAPGFWKGVAAALPADAHIMGLTQDYGYDLMYWGWHRIELWPLDTNLSSVKNAGKDPAARFAGLTTGNDYFLVTAFGQLDQQQDLKRILAGYPIAAKGNGFVLYDLRK